MTDITTQPVIEVAITPSPPVQVALENAAASEIIEQHEASIDPHAQYATDADLTAHTSNAAIHVPGGGLTNSQIAAGAAIDWSKISKAGAVPADVGAQPLNSRLTEIGALFAAAPVGASLRKSADGNALEFASPRSRILARWGGIEVVTGTTSETNFVNGSFVIPGSTLAANSTIDIYALFSVNATSNSKTVRLKIGNTSFFIGTVTATAALLVLRQIFLTSLNSQIAAPSSLSGTGSAGAAVQSLSIDFSTPQTFQATGQLTDAADNLTLRYFEIREFR